MDHVSRPTLIATAGFETGSGGKNPRSNATSSPATALHITEEDWEAGPVLVMSGKEAMRGRPLTLASTDTTGSFATAFAHTSLEMGGPAHRITEIDISPQGGRRVPSCVPQFNEEEARQAATFASAGSSAYVCRLGRTHGHAMYACPFLAPEQRVFTAYQNYSYQP